MSFFNTSIVLAAPVANTGTVTFPYPAGTSQVTFTGINAATGHVAIIDNNDVWTAAASKISVSFGSSDITLTNSSGVTWPAGSNVRVQLDINYLPSITDNSGGSGSATIAAIGSTYNQAEVRNAIATLASVVNRISGYLVARGIIPR